jgi:poly-beta-1,6-N-acetyl-D-glucosamine synthase
MAKRTLSVIIPAYNEEKVISSSLQSLTKVIDCKDIFVVSDGSTDNTVSIARAEGVNVLALEKNGGKGVAQKKVIEHYKLTKKYKYVMFADADSCLSDNFLAEVEGCLKINPALIVGTVTSHKKGLISAFRTYEYGLSHRIYKSAQNTIQAVTVAPGCASIYRGDVLAKLDLDSPTLTEDFDLTIQIHKKKLGKVIYVKDAVVTTQDPLTFRDYWKQVLRWSTGTWQNFFMHKLYKPNSKFNLELLFLFLDNFLWLATLYVAIFHPQLFLNMFEAMFASIAILGSIVAFLERKFWILPYTPLFPIFYFINIFAYYYSLFRVIFGGKKTFAWNKVGRYAA